MKPGLRAGQSQSHYCFCVDPTGRRKKVELAPKGAFPLTPGDGGLKPPPLPASTEGKGKERERTKPKEKLVVSELHPS